MPVPARFPVTTISGMPVVRVPAEIDITNAGLLREALRSAAACGHATIVVDMSETAFCDTVGLQVLVLGHRRARAEGGEIRLVARAAPLLRLFRLTGIDRVIPNFATLDGAVSELPAIAILPSGRGTRPRGAARTLTPG
jgi:anti-sigma B factor antagonist